MKTTKEKYQSRYCRDNIPLSDFVLIEMMKIEVMTEANEIASNQLKTDRALLKEQKSLNNHIEELLIQLEIR